MLCRLRARVYRQIWVAPLRLKSPYTMVGLPQEGAHVAWNCLKRINNSQVLAENFLHVQITKRRCSLAMSTLPVEMPITIIHLRICSACRNANNNHSPQDFQCLS